MEEEEVQVSDVTTMAAEIAAAFVGHNSVKADEVPNVIKAVHGSLEQIVLGKTEAPATVKPAVSIRSSIKPDHIVCLEDGRKYKSLKRHLRTQHGMTPDEYRSKWNLRSDYPIVAPRYAEVRSKLAKSIGLGRALRRRTDRDGQPIENTDA